MGGKTMFIVIGVLIGLVVIFLGVTGFLDRKKRKKAKTAHDEHQKEVSKSGDHVIIFLNLLIKKNDSLVENFVPSIGKLKMNDIRDRAKKGLKALYSLKAYKLAKQSEGIFEKKLIENIEKFKALNSNVWSKSKEVSFFKGEYDKLENVDKEIIEEYSDILKEIYEPTK